MDGLVLRGEVVQQLRVVLYVLQAQRSQVRILTEFVQYDITGLKNVGQFKSLCEPADRLAGGRGGEQGVF